MGLCHGAWLGMGLCHGAWLGMGLCHGARLGIGLCHGARMFVHSNTSSQSQGWGKISTWFLSAVYQVGVAILCLNIA